ncbi:MAG TPA: PAS domain S-box protein [Gemmatimonadaceae bacterium]|nr:PAS domain S-box protein [Gemmatimonadaceae bacterium]
MSESRSDSRSIFVRYGSALVAIALATWLRALLDPLLGTTYPYSTLAIAVLVTAWYGGVGPALVAVAVGAISADFFLLPPRFAFARPNLADLAGMALFVITGVGIALMGGGMRSAVKRARREMQKRLDQLRSSVENAPGATAMFDTEMRYLVTSARYRADFGLDGKDIVGRSHYDVIPGIPARWREIHARCLRGSIERSDEEPFLKPDGTIQWLRWEVRPWRRERDQIGGLVMYTEDITGRRLAEDALRTSEERMRLMIEGAKDYGITMLDPRGLIITWNSGAQKLLGYASDEIVGRSLSLFYARGDVGEDRAQFELERAAAQGQADIEGWHLRKDGSRFWGEGVLSALLNGNEVRGFCMVVRDVTERRRTEELLRSVLYNALDGIASVDISQRIESFNRAGERLFGYTAQEVAGQPITLLIPESYAGHLAPYFAGDLLTGESRVSDVSAELVGRRKDGSTFPLEIAVTEFRLENERHFTVVLRDLTTKSRLEEQLRQSQKLEAFGQLAGGIAHDFNNLLTVIGGDSEILLTDLEADDPRRSLVADIRDAGTRASSLTRQLLAFSRRQVLEPKVINLNDIIRNTEKMLTRIIGEDIGLSSSLDPNIPPVMVDPGQMEQVMLNLAVNARDAMPRGGRLTIETRNVVANDAPYDADEDWKPGRYAMLAMSDTGHGMEPEVKARIFEPFFTTKGPGKGTGLGLATVFGIVKQSEGLISVYSEPGVGTTFKVYFPECVRDTPIKGTRTVTTPAVGGRETILLVEDEDSVRTVARRILTGRGYNVLEARSGDAALGVLGVHASEIDLVVTDVVMPGMSGRQLAEAVRATRPDTRVLFMSGYTDDAVVRHGIIHENEAFIHKPFSPDALARRVREVLDATR